MDILIKIAQFVLSLSILIVAHELGHFLFAKLFNTRVEKFYLFFDPWFSLFKIKKGDTEYGIGWLPLGGYVKISGMIDESMDKEAMQQPPQPWEFRSKPTWQRLLIMVGGVLVNFILAFVIFSMICFTWGKDEIPLSHAQYGMKFSQTALDAGFQNGDKILAVDGFSYENIHDLTDHIVFNKAQEVDVERDGQKITIRMPDDLTAQVLNAKEKVPFTTYICPFIIDSIVAGTPAEKSGLKKGDLIVAVNDTLTPSYTDVSKKISPSKGREISLRIDRQGQAMNLSMLVNKEGKIGMGAKDPNKILNGVHVDYTLAESIPAGINLGISTLTDYVGKMKLIFTKEGASNLGGFITIGSIFPSTWNWHSFWALTAFLSIILAFMNILPIPALDGGHVLFLLYEIITGRKPSDKFLEYAQVTGMIILFGLLLFANGNDIFRLFDK